MVVDCAVAKKRDEVLNIEKELVDKFYKECKDAAKKRREKYGSAIWSVSGLLVVSIIIWIIMFKLRGNSLEDMDQIFDSDFANAV